MRSREQLMKKRIINVMILAAAVTFLSVLAFYVRVGVTADSVAVLRATGNDLRQLLKQDHNSTPSIEGSFCYRGGCGWWLGSRGYDTKVVKPEVLAEKVKGAGFGSTVHVVLTPEQFKQVTAGILAQKPHRHQGVAVARAADADQTKKAE